MQDLQKELGYFFKDQALLALALTHRSCGHKNNEKLEFLGDSILNYVAAQLIFDNFPKIEEGQMSRFRAGMVSQVALERVARRIGIENYLEFVPDERVKEPTSSMLADALEAVFAAVKQDANLATAMAVISRHLIIMINNNEVRTTKDPKTMLQELVQGRGIELPIYTLVRRIEDANGSTIEASCEIPYLKIRTLGRGPTRKQAEALAAEKAINVARQ